MNDFGSFARSQYQVLSRDLLYVSTIRLLLLQMVLLCLKQTINFRLDVCTSLLDLIFKGY